MTLQDGKLLRERHVHYITHLDDDKETIEYMMTEHLRMGGMYWGITGLDLLGALDDARKDEIVSWVLGCQDPRSPGGFGPNHGHDAHITSTHYAILVSAEFHMLHR